MVAEKYWLRPWVYGCLHGQQLTLLDIKGDRYIAIEAPDLQKLLPYIHIQGAEVQTACENSAPDTIQELLSADLITSESKGGKKLSKCHVDPPINPFEHLECDDWPAIHWHHVVASLMAGIKAQLYLQILPLRFIIKQLRKRISASKHKNNDDKALELGRIYHQLRPILLKSRICLFDTLSFVYFCHFYGLQPTIVFGVASNPFEAHCWAQSGGLILNDVPQYTSRFSPIMTV